MASGLAMIANGKPAPCAAARKEMPEVGLTHCQVSFFSRVHSWAIDYHAHSVGELQDKWREELDPLMGSYRQSGLSYEIRQVD